MKFSIITPSFKQVDWLKRCVASVRDQASPIISVAHIVQDGGTDGIAAIFPPADSERYSFRLFSEKDRGMYDAVNKGLRRADGDVCAYINCDEQYLPGALERVAAAFAADTEVDIIFADAVVTDSVGGYLCSRRVVVPQRVHTTICHLNTLTAAMFFRRRVLEQHQLFFNSEWRDLGDVVWVLEAIKAGLKMKVLRGYTTAFADTGENMNLRPNALAEGERMKNTMPVLRHFSTLWVIAHRLRKLLAGCYFEKPFAYRIYTGDDVQARKNFNVARPTSIWRGRFNWKI
ncbi:MAG: glycosyltransferase [Verrucomicrobiales bacterium]|jgi:glycosyltransferase involved in cell wall biosynthesis|nr:glycosyltransferase [Verrucomicrobiales bacterium]